MNNDQAEADVQSNVVRIDSHHHFWLYSPEEYGWISDDMAVLKQDYLHDDLAAELSAHHLTAAVSVQARQSVAETAWLLDIADSAAPIAGVVGWLPLQDVNVSEVYDQFAERKLLKGLRHVVQDEPDDRFLLRPEFNRGLQLLEKYGWTYDILIYARQLPAAIEFVDQHPEQPFVLDHIAKPTIAAATFDKAWSQQIRELAKRDHVCCKFSGVVTEVRDDAWTTKTIQPYWETALNAFGSERLMFGSDWPVCLLQADYGRWVTTVEALAAELSPAEQVRFWGQNAIDFYGLDVCSPS